MRDFAISVIYLVAGIVAVAMIMAAVLPLAVKAKRFILATAIGKRIKAFRDRRVTYRKETRPLGLDAFDEALQGNFGCTTLLAMIVTFFAFLAWILLQVDAFGLSASMGKPPLWTGLFFLPVVLLSYLPELRLPEGLARRGAHQLLSFTVALFQFAGFLMLLAGVLFLFVLIHDK